MTLFVRCDGCGGEVPRPALDARHDGLPLGDDVPPPHFHWCRLCTRAAFAAVWERVHGRPGVRRGPGVPPVYRSGRAELPVGVSDVPPRLDMDETKVQEAVDQTRRWMPNRRSPQG